MLRKPSVMPPRRQAMMPQTVATLPVMTTWKKVNRCRVTMNSRTGGLAQHLHAAVDLFRRVVMRQADAQRAAVRFQPQALHQFQRVIIAVPGADAGLCQ